MRYQCLIITFTTALLIAGCQAETRTQTSDALPAQTTCQEPEYRQMDFWVGDWDLSWTNAEGAIQKGRNTITQSPYGDCVITENFDGLSASPLRGMSVSTYSKPHGLWRQTWVDNNGSYFSLYGGPQSDGSFILDMNRLGDQGPYSRMVFEKIEADSLTWRWQGKQAEADEWADQWVINYERR